MKILLIGVGNLGKRYLEGLIKLKLKKKIYLYDQNKIILKDVKKKFCTPNNNVFSISELEELKRKKIDVCIVATTASSRHKIIKKINEMFNIKFWILEKLVSNKIRNFDKIYNILKNSKAYVNLPRSYCLMHQYLKKQKLKKINFNIEGGNWNIGSNCIHHLYLVEWLTGEKVKDITVHKKKFYLTKRKNFSDFYGKILAYTDFGSKIKIVNNNNKKKFNIIIKHKKDTWLIDEHSGILKKNGKFLFKNQFNFQSQITPTIIKSLNKKCKLPLLNELYDLHKSVLINFEKLNFFNVT